MSRHECPAKGCDQLVPYSELACRRHWFQLPPQLRQRIGRAWRRAQKGDVDAGAEHTAAITEAIELLR